MSIPEPKGKKKSRKTGGGLPEPEQGGDFDPFLKASDIGDEGTQAKIEVLGAPVETESEFSDAVMPIRFKGKQYALGIKWSGVNYRKLYEKFGKKEKSWKGKVAVEVKHFKKNDYVAIL